MFKDYYAILDIQPPVTEQDIKTAYRKQALRWHPDRNLYEDTTKIMQDIIEAYIFLKDKEARSRYDQTYFAFKGKNQESNNDEMRGSSQKDGNGKSSPKYNYNYEFADEILKRWMSNAREQAKGMRKDVIDEFRGAIEEGGKSIMHYILTLLIPMIFGLLAFKSCGSIFH